MRYAASVNDNAVSSVQSYSTINYMNGITYGTVNNIAANVIPDQIAGVDWVLNKYWLYIG